MLFELLQHEPERHFMETIIHVFREIFMNDIDMLIWRYSLEERASRTEYDIFRMIEDIEIEFALFRE